MQVTIRCLTARPVLPAILELLACKDQPLLVRGDPLLVLDLGLHILDGVARLDLQGNGLAREGLDEDLHSTSAIKLMKLLRKFFRNKSLSNLEDWTTATKSRAMTRESPCAAGLVWYIVVIQREDEISENFDNKTAQPASRDNSSSRSSSQNKSIFYLLIR